MRYGTIVADPPWDHSDGTGVHVGAGTVTGLPYSTMSVDEIADLPVRDWSSNGSHLYLWTTGRYLAAGYRVACGWGFEYQATLVWCKPSRGWGPGGAFQNNVEFVLFAKRQGSTSAEVLRLTTALALAAERAGVSRLDVDRHMGTSDMGGWWLSRLEHRCACPTLEQWPRLKALLCLDDSLDGLVLELNEAKGRRTEQVPSRWFQWPRGEHSAKPEAFLDIVEHVSPGPYLELFARRARFGWDYWGDESLGTAELSGAA